MIALVRRHIVVSDRSQPLGWLSGCRVPINLTLLRVSTTNQGDVNITPVFYVDRSRRQFLLPGKYMGKRRDLAVNAWILIQLPRIITGRSCNIGSETMREGLYCKLSLWQYLIVSNTSTISVLRCCLHAQFISYASLFLSPLENNRSLHL